MHVLIMGSGGVGGFVGSRLVETGQERHLRRPRPPPPRHPRPRPLHAQRNRNPPNPPRQRRRTPGRSQRPTRPHHLRRQVLRHPPRRPTPPPSPKRPNRRPHPPKRHRQRPHPVIHPRRKARHRRRHLAHRPHRPNPASSNIRTPMVRAAIGEPAGAITDRVQTIAHALRAAGIQTEVTNDINHVLWNKLVLLSVLGPVSAACQLPLGPILATRGMLDLFRTMFERIHRRRPIPGHRPPRLHHRPTSSTSLNPSHPTTPPPSRSTSPTNAASNSTTPPAQ